MDALRNIKQNGEDIAFKEDFPKEPKEYLHYLNRQIKYRTNRIKEHLKEYDELHKTQEQAIQLGIEPKIGKIDRDKYNKLYFFTVSRIDKLKVSIYLNKKEIGALEAKRDLLLKSL